MKTLWNILAIMSLVNIIALAGLIGWLKSSDRLNQDRLVALRQVFVKTVAEEAQEKAELEARMKAADEDRQKAEKAAEPPITASEKIAEQQFRDEQRTQLVQRQQQELENLRSSLMSQLAKLEEREKKLESDKRAFDADRKRIAALDQDKQFKLALSTLEGQKPKDAKNVLKAIIDQQKQPEQAVNYLAKMEETKRAKVMAEFVKEDAALAADLLERLRTRGIVLPPNSPQVTANDANPPGSATKP